MKQILSNYPMLLEEWHYEKNGKINPFEIKGSFVAWWKCLIKKDHEWEATLSSRISGRGCPCCIGKKVVLSNCLATTYPAVAAQWHPALNGTLTPFDVTSGSNKKIWWKCPVAKDHEWQASVKNRTKISLSNKGGCPCCNGKKIVQSNSLSFLFPEIAKEWHPTKNGLLTPRDLAPNSEKHGKIWWLGKCGHEWQAMLSDRIRFRGCPACKESIGERKVSCILENMGLKFIRQARFKTCKKTLTLPFDFFVEDKFLIEFHGEQHYRPVRWNKKLSEDQILAIFQRTKINDLIKTNWAKEQNIPLLVIGFFEYKEIKSILYNFCYRLQARGVKYEF